jgi:hypothetical protein
VLCTQPFALTWLFKGSRVFHLYTRLENIVSTSAQAQATERARPGVGMVRGIGHRRDYLMQFEKRRMVRLSAIKIILATFGDFDGVGQLIATKLLTKRVWTSSWQGGIKIDCVSEVYPKEIDYHHPGVTAYVLVVFPPAAGSIQMK